MNGNRKRFVVSAVFITMAGSSLADWPQWRGPNRDGVAVESPALASEWPEEGPPQLWTSEKFPAKSGEGSVVAANGRAYLYLDWRREDPVPTRKIDGSVFGKVRWFDQERMPAGILTAMEEARRARSARLRGDKLNEWAKQWVEEHVPEEHKSWRGTVENRLKEGPAAISLEVLAKLASARNREFPNQAALEKWLDDEKISGAEREAIVAAVPTTVPGTDDVILCFDLTDGKTLWKRKLPGNPNGMIRSATPAIAGGRLFVLGTTHAHCLDAETGEPIWATEVPNGSSTSSFLVTEKTLFVLAGRLIAFDRESGKIAWEQEEVRARRSSPTLWRHDGTDYVLANDDAVKKLVCVRADAGELVWTAPGGGYSSPVVSGDIAVVHAPDGLAAYRMGPSGAEELWRLPHEGRGSATPIVHDGRVYLLGSGRMLCAALEDGAVHWTQEKFRAEVSSAFLAAGKLFALTGNGSELMSFDASPGALRPLGKAKVRAMWCPSPAFSGGRVLLRHQEFVACYDLRARAAGEESAK